MSDWIQWQPATQRAEMIRGDDGVVSMEVSQRVGVGIEPWLWGWELVEKGNRTAYAPRRITPIANGLARNESEAKIIAGFVARKLCEMDQ